MPAKLRTCAHCGASVTRPKSRAVGFRNVALENRRKNSKVGVYTVADRIVCKDRRACAGRIAAALKAVDANPNHVPNPLSINAPGGPLNLAPIDEVRS